MKTTEEPVTVEQIYDAPIDAVWQAITELEQMRQWYFEQIPAFKAEVGFETGFDVQSEDRIFAHKWRVEDVVPLKRIRYRWSYANYPGDSYVVFEISPQNGGARLRLTCVVLEDFPDDVPEFTRQSGVDGWEYLLQQRLAEYLAKEA